jgi:hypothetical protein
MRLFTHGSRGAAALLAAATLLAAAGCSSSSKTAGGEPAAPTYSITGTVSGATVSGVVVRIQGTGVQSTTNALGQYAFYGLYNGTYTLEATKAGYTFTPPTLSVPVNGANVTGQNFVAVQSISVSGTVTGEIQEGVTVTMVGPDPSTAATSVITDASGDYRIWNVAAGVYHVTPSRAGGWTFSPPNALVTVAGVSLTGPDFVSISPTFTLSGQVTGAAGAGVVLTLSGDGSGVAVADGTGNYVFTGLSPGSYKVTPSYPGVFFTPADRAVTIGTANATGQNFVAAATHSISGRISGDVLAGVKVSLSGAATADVTTDASGSYEFTGLADGAYTVAPALDGYDFSPAQRLVTLSGANVGSVSFTATAAVNLTGHAVSGTVGGAVLYGVTVTLQGDPSAATTLVLTTTTDAAGAFRFQGVEPGEYLVIPSHDDHDFDPGSRFIVVAGVDVGGQTFTATVKPTARTIAGNVSGAVTAGVTLTLAGPTTGTATTDGAGDFAFRGLADGVYTVTPSLAGYVFSPANCMVTVNGPSVTLVQFTSAVARHAISGTVTGPTAAGVTVQLDGAASRTTFTAGDGTYTFTGLPDGEYTVSTSLAGSYFIPARRSVTVDRVDVGGVDFVSALAHSLSGHVTLAGGAPLAGAAVALTGASSAVATTDAAGLYTFAGLPDGGYTVTASRPGYAFSPVFLPVTLAGANVTNGDFVATLIPTYTVSGTISGAGGLAIPVRLSGAMSDSTTTDAGGRYSFAGLPDGSYMVVPNDTGTYTPAARAFRINAANVTGQDFVRAP